MSADSIFGEIEKKYKKGSEIVLKEDYEEILREAGRVRRLGEEWVVWDIRKMIDVNCRELISTSNMQRSFIKKEIITTRKIK